MPTRQPNPGQSRAAVCGPAAPALSDVDEATSLTREVLADPGANTALRVTAAAAEGAVIRAFASLVPGGAEILKEEL